MKITVNHKNNIGFSCKDMSAGEMGVLVFVEGLEGWVKPGDFIIMINDRLFIPRTGASIHKDDLEYYRYRKFIAGETVLFEF